MKNPAIYGTEAYGEKEWLDVVLAVLCKNIRMKPFCDSDVRMI